MQRAPLSFYQASAAGSAPFRPRPKCPGPARPFLFVFLKPLKCFDQPSGSSKVSPISILPNSFKSPSVSPLVCHGVQGGKGGPPVLNAASPFSRSVIAVFGSRLHNQVQASLIALLIGFDRCLDQLSNNRGSACNVLKHCRYSSVVRSFSKR
jgi:hypothetical protein